MDRAFPDDTGISGADGPFVLPVLLGATGSGKSAFAIKLAQALNAEIISADSAQIYKDLSIITARTLPEEMEGISHHLTGFLSLDHRFSVADFQKLAYEAIADIRKKGRTPLLVGGTNHYIKAVAEGYTFAESASAESVRSALLEKAEKEGTDELYRRISEMDPVAAAKIHPNNQRRIIRALEVMEMTGRRFSDVSRKACRHPLGLKPFYMQMDFSRETLYDRIEDRVDKMIAMGAFDEVKRAFDRYGRGVLTDASILGVREILWVLDGLCTMKEGIGLIKRNTKRFSKRQLTWIRSFDVEIRINGEELTDATGFGEIIDRIKGSFNFSGN